MIHDRRARLQIEPPPGKGFCPNLKMKCHEGTKTPRRIIEINCYSKFFILRLRDFVARLSQIRRAPGRGLYHLEEKKGGR
jgi:hypothetical protein